MIVIREIEKNGDLAGEQNIYCSNECFNNSVEYKKYDKDYARFQSFHEIYTSPENYPNFITELLSVDKSECTTCGTIINEQNQVNKSIEIIDKVIFSEKNQALLGDHVIGRIYMLADFTFHCLFSPLVIFVFHLKLFLLCQNQ